ncbi:hypothetical protein [Waddlia chondrophila]|uniref:Uncharacterized protein n=1 Tax=Waddlia chondrophila (strain ATCC VR-1470 / WSU 86-1044) TaxID=716544 RepID=D6YWA0_WADCW|nr:hypothetical protein [Waddlia chondrophila]ADI38411.1 hypothetical protein wcw_1052 [Waddlia chondrophila WSU 86-1044]
MIPSATDPVDISRVNEPSSIKNSCPFLKLISKIWNAIKKIFKAIKNKFSPSPYNLSKKDLEHLQAAKQHRRSASRPSSLSETNLSERNVEVKTAEEAESTHGEESRVIDDPVYQEFVKESMNFINLALETTYEEKIEPLIPGMKEKIDGLDSILKFGADVAISITSGVYRPLVEKLDQLSIAEKLAPSLQQFIHGLLKDKDKINQEDFRVHLEQKLTDITDDNKNDAIEKCITWLFNTDQADPLFKGGDFNRKNIFEKVLREAILLLVEKRISEFNEKVHDHLKEDLSEIIKRMVVRNGSKLGEIVLNRLIEVIDKTPFTETFNEIIALFADQSAAVVSAENAREKAIEEEKSRLERYDRAVKDNARRDAKEEEEVRQSFILLRTDNLEETKELWIEEAGIQAEKRANEEVRLEFQQLQKEKPESSVLKMGLEKWSARVAASAREKAESEARKEIEEIYHSDDNQKIATLEMKMRDLWLQKVGEKAAKEEYKKFLVQGKPFCHPCIEDLELVRDEKEKKSSDIVSIILNVLELAFKPEDVGEKHLFDASANRLMQLLFPPVTVVDSGGESHQVDGLLYLFNQIEWGSEFKEIYKEAAFICREIGATDEQKRIVKVIESSQSRIEQYVLRWTRNEIKSTISDSIASLFKKIVVPSQIDEMMAFDLLPSIQDAMVQSLVKNLISDKIAVYSPMFAKVIDSEDEKEEVRSALIKEILLKIKENLNSSEFEDERLNKLIEEQVMELEAVLEDFLSEREAADEEDREVIIGSALKDIFKKEYHGGNARYGDLVINTVFKLGKLSSIAEYFADWFKGILSREISSATHELQDSPRYLLKIATQKIHTSYPTKDAVKDLIYKPAEVIPTEDTKKKLDEEIKKTAGIAHDFLFYLSKQQSFISRKAIQLVIGSNPNHLEEVVNRIYQKMFSNPLYTQNLIVRVQEGVAKALQKGGEALDSIPKEIPVDHVPSMIPSFVFS